MLSAVFLQEINTTSLTALLGNFEHSPSWETCPYLQNQVQAYAILSTPLFDSLASPSDTLSLCFNV